MLPANAVTIHAVQFVGTNVEMTYTVDLDAAGLTVDAVEGALDALLASRLRLHAITPTGDLDGRPRFSVMGSPLERLFHKIGPSVPLTLIKHASVTLDLSEVNLVRQGEGLLRSYPGPGESAAEDEVEVWTPWDAGKLLGMLLRKPELLEAGAVRVADEGVEAREFPQAILPTLTRHVEAHDGVRVWMGRSVRQRLRTAAPS